jgi:hypothetical protein
MDANRIVPVTAGGEFLAVTGQDSQTKWLNGALLVAGADAATMIVRETDGSGRILYDLKAAAAGGDQALYAVTFVGKIHVTFTGTSPKGYVLEP